MEKEEKPPVKREFAVRSPSPPAEDSEPELTEDLKEEVLVSAFSAFKQTASLKKILMNVSFYIFLLNLLIDGHHQNPPDRNPAWSHERRDSERGPRDAQESHPRSALLCSYI